MPAEFDWRESLRAVAPAAAGALTGWTIADPIPLATRSVFSPTGLAVACWIVLGIGLMLARRRSQQRRVSSPQLRILAPLAIAWCALVFLAPVLRPGDGLTGRYFEAPDWTGSTILTANDAQPSTAQLADHDLPDTYSAIWTGFVVVPRDSTYEFTTRSDDDSWLLVDDAPVVDNGGGPHGSVTRSGQIGLSAGPHQITVKYVQRGGGYELALALGEPGGEPRPIPDWMLTRRRASYFSVFAGRYIQPAATGVAIALFLCAVFAAAPVARRAGLAASVMARTALGPPRFVGDTRQTRDEDSLAGPPAARVPVRTWVALAAIWGIATAVNVTKAFHIDDTAYLDIAAWIAQHPIRPMSGTIFWYDTSAPIATLNQPHLVFYVMAIWMRLFGSSEVAQHLLMSLFTLGSILLFHDLCATVLRRDGVLPVALLFLGPAFMPSQNMMVDVPLLFFWLLFFRGIELAGRREESRGLLVAGIAAAGAVMTKYTGLVLIPILVFFMWRLDRLKDWLVLAIPVGVIAAWSAFNYWDYGQVHILNRQTPGGVSNLGRVVLRATPAWLVALGGVAPLFALPFSRRRGMATAGCAVAALAFGLWMGARYAGMPENERGVIHWINSAAAFLFAANGLWMVSTGVANLAESRGRTLSPVDAEWMLVWFAGAAMFICLFAPFMAVRHVLIALPPLVLALFLQRQPLARRRAEQFTLALSVSLGLVIAVSDWHYADVYRTAARQIRQELGDRRVWFTGHWGWQWYARAEQMLPYEPGRSELGAGDLIVQPRIVDAQGISPDDKQRLRYVRTVEVRWTVPTLARTMTRVPFGGFYYSLGSALPWRISEQHLDIFNISVVD